MMNPRRLKDRNGWESKGEESENPFFEGGGSSSDEEPDRPRRDQREDNTRWKSGMRVNILEFDRNTLNPEGFIDRLVAVEDSTSIGIKAEVPVQMPPRRNRPLTEAYEQEFEQCVMARLEDRLDHSSFDEEPDQPRRDQREDNTGWESRMRLNIPEFKGNTLNPEGFIDWLVEVKEGFIDWLVAVEEMFEFKEVPENIRRKDRNGQGTKDEESKNSFFEGGGSSSDEEPNRPKRDQTEDNRQPKFLLRCLQGEICLILKLMKKNLSSVLARMEERLDQFVNQLDDQKNDMMNLRRCRDHNGRGSEVKESENPFFEGGSSSSDEEPD
nr:hypothetical protein [Tanacetum cinerariifolium]